MSDTPGGTTRSRANTRAKLLEAAPAVLGEKGLMGASVDDLASAAGFSRGAFYSNYATKEDLLIDLYRSANDRLGDVVREIWADLPREGLEPSDLGKILDSLAPLGSEFFVIEHEYLLMARRNPEQADELLANSGGLQEGLLELITDLLWRMGRRPVMPTPVLASLLTSTFSTALSRSAAFGHDSEYQSFSNQIVPAIIEYLTEPIE